MQTKTRFEPRIDPTDHTGSVHMNDEASPRRRPTGDEVWRALERSSFAIVGHVTPAGEPRSSGIVYKVIARRLYVVVGTDSWKARHIAANGRVSVTVPVRRGGILSLLFPIPPATISFHGVAVVHPPGSPEMAMVAAELGAMLPPEARTTSSVLEIVPHGAFVTYAIGIPLRKMRDTAAARGRVPVDD